LATLSLEQLTKVFPNGVEAVRGFDLFVDEGEFVVLVGPSGCGKTTVLRMVAGLEEVTSGTIRLDDRVVNDVSARDRDVAMVFQNYALYPHLDVLRNIAFSLRVRGVPKHERDRKAREAADVLGLTEVVLRKPRQLSGGQRQRVAMGRALVREPAVFLMDEPLSNLDANLRVQMRSEVLRVQRHLGVATLYVTHDQTEAMTMGDRVAVLSSGTLQQLAAPQELYESPANLFVASFIGSPPMNLYEGAISGPADGLVLSLGSRRLALPADLGHRRPDLVAGEGRKVVVGIRPEHLTVVEDGDADTGATLAVRVELVEALGNESLVHFSTDARRVRNKAGAWTPDPLVHASGDIAGASATEGVARVDPRVSVAAGEQVTLAVDVDRLHFFDAETGDAIGAPGRSEAAPLLSEIPPEQEGQAPTRGKGIGNLHR
jgi:multiple sugar transport system ATP-binding protein